MPLDVRGQNYRSLFQQQIHFLISKPQHNRSPSVKRQTWTITISTEKRQTFVGLLFLTELPSKSFPWWKFLQETEAKSQHFQMQRCRMSHLVLPVTLNSPSQAGHAVVLQFVLRKSAFSIIQLFSRSMLPFSGQSRKKDGQTEESRVWLRWYSTDSVQDDNVFFCLFVRTWWMVALLFRRPPAHHQLSRCHGAERSAGPCLYSEKEIMTQTESKGPSMIPPSILHIRTWAAATLTRGGKRRGRFNWSGTSGDQSVY